MYDGAEVYIPKNAVYESNRFVLGFDNKELQIKADHVALRKAFQIKSCTRLCGWSLSRHSN